MNNRPMRRRTPAKSNILDFPVPTVDLPEPEPTQPRQITRENIQQLLDTGQLEANLGDGVWRTMVRADGEWRLTGLHRREMLAISFKIKWGGRWLYDRIYGNQFDDDGVLNRPDKVFQGGYVQRPIEIRINTAVDGPTCHRPASEVNAIVADLMKHSSLYTVLAAVEDACLENAWPEGHNEVSEGFDGWMAARMAIDNLLGKPIVAKVSIGEVGNPRWIAYEKRRQRDYERLAARLEREQARIESEQAVAARHADLRAALIENPDQPQAMFVKRYHVHPDTVRRVRRGLEREGTIPVLSHRHQHGQPRRGTARQVEAVQRTPAPALETQDAAAA